MELKEEEKKVLEKPTSEIVWNDYKVLSEVLKKLNTTKDKKLISFCQTRAALAIERSTRPHYEKARHFEEAARKAIEAGFPCAQLFGYAAEYIGRDMGHTQAAQLFREAAIKSIEEKLDKNLIRSYYMSSRKHFDLSGDSVQASLVFVEEADLRLKAAGILEKVFLFIYKLLSNYGESPKRVAFSAMIMILVCSIFYTVIGIQSSAASQIIHSFTTSLYFSVVTFTTLGYGDYSPVGSFGRVVASTEAVSGLFLMSLFLATIVRKYSR